MSDRRRGVRNRCEARPRGPVLGTPGFSAGRIYTGRQLKVSARALLEPVQLGADHLPLTTPASARLRASSDHGSRTCDLSGLSRTECSHGS